MGPGEADSIRAFIAVSVTDDVRRAAAGLIRESRGKLEGVRWIEPDNLHVTVKFLGQTRLEMIEEIGLRMRRALAAFPAFRAVFSGVGAFPTARRPRVLYVDMQEGAREMAGLCRLAEGALEPLGFAPEKREAAPHLTVGRVKFMKNPEGFLRWIEANRGVAFGTCRVGALSLFRSDLRPEGAVYTMLETYQTAVEG